MSAHNPDTIDAIDEFNQGVSFGQHEARRALLPLLKAVSYLLMRTTVADHRGLVVGTQLAKAIADIERPPAPPTSTPPTDDESIPF